MQTERHETPDTLCIAAVSDLHYGRHSADEQRHLFEQASEKADVLLLCGDLTDYGRPREAEELARDLDRYVDIPVLAILGNHDFEVGQTDEVGRILESVGVTMLDGECVEIDGVGFAGVCGFGGGFGAYLLNAWGEPAVKAFVDATLHEVQKLEHALTMLDTEHRIVLMHYAPVRATVEGEPPEIYPFLGSSRLEAPLDQFEVTAVFHGHAHKGTPEGKTMSGVPVYNVSMPVLKAHYPGQVPFRLLEVPRRLREPAPPTDHVPDEPVR